MPTPDKELERLQRADHDTLIRLEGKVDTLSDDIKGLSNRITTQLIDHEARIKVLELWRHDFRLTWKLMVAVATFIGTVLGILSQVVIAFLHSH